MPAPAVAPHLAVMAALGVALVLLAWLVPAGGGFFDTSRVVWVVGGSALGLHLVVSTVALAAGVDLRLAHAMAAGAVVLSGLGVGVRSTVRDQRQAADVRRHSAEEVERFARRVELRGWGLTSEPVLWLDLASAEGCDLVVEAVRAEPLGSPDTYVDGHVALELAEPVSVRLEPGECRRVDLPLVRRSVWGAGDVSIRVRCGEQVAVWSSEDEGAYAAADGEVRGPLGVAVERAVLGPDAGLLWGRWSQELAFEGTTAWFEGRRWGWERTAEGVALFDVGGTEHRELVGSRSTRRRWRSTWRETGAPSCGTCEGLGGLASSAEAPARRSCKRNPVLLARSAPPQTLELPCAPSPPRPSSSAACCRPCCCPRAPATRPGSTPWPTKMPLLRPR